MANDVLLVRGEIFQKHTCSDPHPEKPARVQAFLDRIAAHPVYKTLPNLKPSPIQQDELLRVHSPQFLKRLEKTRGEVGWLDPDTYYNAESADVAKFAAGACWTAAQKIWSGEYRRGFCVIRPPGHHATPDKTMGFCLLNNIAIAARGITEVSSKARLAIVDFDLHHGNGTQETFYTNPNVLFISSHRFPFYPGTGAMDEVGDGPGKGTTLNFALGTEYGHELFVPLYAEFVLPVLKAYRPDMILVSAGFDGHEEDPMQGLNMKTETFGALAEILIHAAELTKGKILFVLEGGYNPTAVADSGMAVLDKIVSLPQAIFQLSPGFLGNAHSAVLQRFREVFSPFFPELR